MIDTKAMARFLEHVMFVDETACWVWIGSKDKDGYGRVAHNGKIARAHRVAFEFWRPNESLEGLEGAHTCHIRSCVSPFHIRPSTHAENMAMKRFKDAA